MSDKKRWTTPRVLEDEIFVDALLTAPYNDGVSSNAAQGLDCDPPGPLDDDCMFLGGCVESSSCS